MGRLVLKIQALCTDKICPLVFVVGILFSKQKLDIEKMKRRSFSNQGDRYALSELKKKKLFSTLVSGKFRLLFHFTKPNTTTLLSRELFSCSITLVKKKDKINK